MLVLQVTVYQCLEGGVIAVLQSYIDEDVRKFKLLLCSILEILNEIHVLRQFVLLCLLRRSER